jgi:membrane-associated protein
MIAALTPFLLVLGPIALLVAMGIVFAETGLLIGFFLPRDYLLFTLGVLSAGGLLHLPLWLIAVGLLLAAMAGDQVGYLLGRRFGPRVFNRAESRVVSLRSSTERHRGAHGRRDGPHPVPGCGPPLSPRSPPGFSVATALRGRMSGSSPRA